MGSDPILTLLILIVIALFVYLHYKKQSLIDLYKELKEKL
jgi:hypothetical protein